MNYRSTSVLWTNGKMNNGYTYESTTMLSMEAKYKKQGSEHTAWTQAAYEDIRHLRTNVKHHRNQSTRLCGWRLFVVGKEIVPRGLAKGVTRPNNSRGTMIKWNRMDTRSLNCTYATSMHLSLITHLPIKF